LDVLVKNDEIDKIFEVLEKENYKYVGSNVLSKKELNNPKLQYKWNNQFQFKVPNDNIVIEVHTNLFERDRIRLEDLSSLLDNVDVFWKNKKWDNDLQCFLPSIEATLALLCVHTATKRSPSANTFILRQTFDILCILNKDLNYKYFKELCRIWHIEYYVYFSLLLTFNIFNKENCTSLLYYFEKELTSSKKLLAAVHLRSFRGLGNASLFYRKVYAFLMPFVIGNGFYKSIKWYLKVLFPPIWNQEKKFGIKRTSPLIYLTYIYGPFIQLYLLITGKYYK